MAILFGTTKSRYPDFLVSDVKFAGKFVDEARSVLNGALGVAGAQIFNGSFVEDGVQSVNGAAFVGSTVADIEAPSSRRVITQTPQATVIVKKKMFSTLRSNYDFRFLDQDERLFIRAVKNLFRRKCEEIAFYENIVNIEKKIQDPSFLTIDGAISDVLGAIGTAADIGQRMGGPLADVINALEAKFPFLSDLQRLQKTNERAKQNKYTTWVVDPDQPNFSTTGPGVGSIELTMFTTINTTVSKETGQGRADIRLEDPYQLTLITEADIDIALKQAISENGGQAGVLDQIAQRNLTAAAELDRQLNSRLRMRGASEVNFDIPLGVDTEPRGTILETNQPFGRNDLEQFGFDSFEQATILQIFNMLESYQTLQARTAGEFAEQNIRSGPVRQRLRSEFVGHHIIQPMDSLHIFVNSFTRQDTPLYNSSPEIVSGNFLQSIISSEEQEGRISDEALEQERQALAPNIPLFFYKLLRNPMEWRATGPQVFSGLVSSVNPTYSSDHGQFHLAVGAVDNIEFLKISQVNTQPSLSQPEGVLMDPLTPFDLVTDPVSGLVVGRELSTINKERLPFLKFDDGTPVLDEQSLVNDIGKSSVKVWQHVPGIVYKWKSGIVSATLNVNMTKTLDTDEFTIDDVSDNFGIHFLDNAFANLDPADIISILVTGQPYNYNSFIRNALEAGTTVIDNDTNNKAYFNTLFDFLDRQNEVWGAFIPAKASIIDPQKTASLYSQQRQLARNITKINDLQRELAKLRDQQQAISINGPSAILGEQIKQLELALDQQIRALDTADELTENSPFKFFGNSVQIDLTEENLREMNSRLKYIVKKKPEEVRYNQDKNYLIISDKYDVDLDIQAFVLSLRQSSPELFKSEWKRPLEICEGVKEMLDFELFADSQGNIVFRPPEYNKTPLSLLLKMMQLGKSQGISLAPPFLLQLLSSRTELVRDKLLAIELEILEKAYMLGFGVADVAAKFGAKLALSGLDSGGYMLDDSAILEEANKSKIFNEEEQQKVVFDFKAEDTANLDRAFVVDQIIKIRNQRSAIVGSTSPRLTLDAETYQNISEELDLYSPATAGSFTRRLTVSNKISQLISQRQSTIPVFNKLVQQSRSVQLSDVGLNFSEFNILPQALGSFIDGMPLDNPPIPKFLEDLIENDLSNMDGFNSGKRFIINDDVILSMNLGVQTPKFTRVDVTGNQNLVNFNGVAGQIGNGAAVFWAGATDFDMWRQYGFRDADANNNKAFLQNPETQCAPYAVFKLVRQRRYIHSGTITVVGNEHYQVGDVVYVNSRQLMYYVEKVDHSYSVANGSFRTTLTLTYGRPLGEYIPTPLDMIGKSLLTNSKRPFGNTKVVRTLSPNPGMVVLDTLVIPTLNPIDSEVNEIFSPRSQSFKTLSGPRIQNAIRRALARMNSESKNARIEIRSYYASQQNLTPSLSGSFISAASSSGVTKEVAEFFARQTKELMVGGSLFPSGLVPDAANESVAALPLIGGMVAPDRLTLDAKNILVCPAVDISQPLSGDNLKFRRIPSEQAWANAMDATYGTSSGLPTNSIDIVLVIDRAINPDATPESERLSQAQGSATPPADTSGQSQISVPGSQNNIGGN